jgi:hypothetical protein
MSEKNVTPTFNDIPQLLMDIRNILASTAQLAALRAQLEVPNPDAPPSPAEQIAKIVETAKKGSSPKLVKQEPAPAAAEKPADTPTTVPADAAPTGKGLSYEEVKAPFLKLAATNRAEAVALLTDLGVKNLKDVKPESYPTLLEAIAKATTRTEAA